MITLCFARDLNVFMFFNHFLSILFCCLAPSNFDLQLNSIKLFHCIIPLCYFTAPFHCIVPLFYLFAIFFPCALNLPCFIQEFDKKKFLLSKVTFPQICNTYHFFDNHIEIMIPRLNTSSLASLFLGTNSFILVNLLCFLSCLRDIFLILLDAFDDLRLYVLFCFFFFCQSIRSSRFCASVCDKMKKNKNKKKRSTEKKTVLV